MTISGGPDGTAQPARAGGHPRTPPRLQRTPEVFGHRDCYGPQASAFTKHALTGLRVRYEIGVEPRDRYGRALVYLRLRDGRSFNEQLVARGYARPLPIAPNTRYAERFARLARAASVAGRGLWSACPA